MTPKSNIIYKKAVKSNWSGRATGKLQNQYWYQAIELIDIENQQKINTDIAIVGYACEEGVRRNLGRIGAKKGPEVIRERLAKVALHHTKKIADVGDIVCVDEHLEACQTAYAEIITKLIKNNVLPIGLGGGHDIAYATFKGIYNSLENKNTSVGILNFDAHFDLRPVETQPNSGTPFNQIINECKNGELTVNYFPIGIQPQANTPSLFTIANDENVTFIDHLHCNFETIKEQLTAFIKNNDHIYITIDMDGFSSAYASGVSAPSPLGFSPNFVIKTLEYLLKSNKVIACDIAELNPKYDIDNQTATLAARLVDFISLYS